MDSPERTVAKLDSEFDQMLADMKPHIMRLPHKSDRQKCALWIRKFCEPPASGISGRKNRNSYAELLLHMLRRGALDGPFLHRPESGPLSALPTYMSVYFDEIKSSQYDPAVKRGQVPDWVAGELGSEAASFASLPAFPGGEPAASSTMKFSTPLHNSPPRNNHPTFDMSSGLGSPPAAAKALHFKDDKDLPYKPLGDWGKAGDWVKPANNTTFLSSQANSMRDDTSLIRMHERELDMAGKMSEARYQEERLRLQQKHDATVQKILDRKNAEIEELKSHYRNKAKEMEESSSKLEKKASHLQKELQSVKENKEKQLEEVKRITEENSQMKQNEFEKKLHDVVANFEQEKFDLQKQHTRNIQDLLEDTNTRVQRMEDEYTAQISATSNMVKELEGRLHQLTSELSTQRQQREQIEREKVELESRTEHLSSQLTEMTNKYCDIEKEHKALVVEHEANVRSLTNKHEANIEFLKQEQNIAAAKASDTISDLESHVAQLKTALENAEQQRQKQVRDVEQTSQQDKTHLENLHENRIRNMQRETEHQEEEYQKQINRLEKTVREKEEDMKQLLAQHKNDSLKSEKALEEFKRQVEKNSTQMYNDLKKQMERCETDLSRSKQLREKQAKDFLRQLEEERNSHIQQLAEVKVAFEQERLQLYREADAEKHKSLSEKDMEMMKMREELHGEIVELQTKAQEQQEVDNKSISELESQMAELREQLVQSNQLRKQQLVELGLLREEEKQRMAHGHESQIAKLKSDLEQQRLDMEKTHSTEMEEMLEKTNARLKEIEKEYTTRSNKASETISELQKTIQSLKEDRERQRTQAHQQVTQINERQEDERKRLRQQHAATLASVQQEVENQKSKVRQLERRLGGQEQDYEDKITQLRGQYEKRIRGLLPSSVRQELEETITSLRSQVVSLQQRAQVLQDELDTRGTLYPGTGQLANSMINSINSSASIKSSA